MKKCIRLRIKREHKPIIANVGNFYKFFSKVSILKWITTALMICNLFEELPCKRDISSVNTLLGWNKPA